MWKKHFTDGVVQIALLLSLLRTDWNNYLNSLQGDSVDDLQEIILGPMSGFTQTRWHGGPWLNQGIALLDHPKNHDLDRYYSSSILRELLSLGQYDRSSQIVQTRIDAYLVSHPNPLRLPSENANTNDNAHGTNPAAPAGTANTANTQSHPLGNEETDSDQIPSPDVEGAVGLDSRENVQSFVFPGSDLTKEV